MARKAEPKFKIVSSSSTWNINGEYVKFEEQRLDKVKLPKSFDGTLVIPAEVTEVARWACQDLVQIKEVVLHDKIKRLGTEAFAGCTGLEKINIPESVRLSEEGCFSGCLALKELHIPANTGLNGRAFIGLPLETKITIDEGNTACIDGDTICSKDGQRFIRLRSDVEEFQVKDGVKEIGQSAFYSCSKLKKLVLPASIEKIDDYALENCISLTTVVVGSEAVRSLVEEHRKKNVDTYDIVLV